MTIIGRKSLNRNVKVKVNVFLSWDHEKVKVQVVRLEHIRSENVEFIKVLKGQQNVSYLA